jgi:hypothetical protein
MAASSATLTADIRIGRKNREFDGFASMNGLRHDALMAGRA